MKISKNILSAVVLGVAMAGATSCEKKDLPGELGIHSCDEKCDEAGECVDTGDSQQNNPDYGNCPTCGMG